jgi:TRAP-type C4-dicarboxylate transport system permease small subunit
MMSRLERLDEAIDRVETAIVVLFISAMMVIAFLQICLRNVFATGLTWGDLILRNLVLWIGFIGATLATREGKHINIDAISRSLPPLGRAMVEVCIHLFSCFICGLLTYASLKFVKNEAEMGAATLINIPAWILEAILPLTFGLMAFRFALRAIKAFFISVKKVQMHDRSAEE